LLKEYTDFTIIPFFSRQYTTDYKLETYLKIARLYLEDADSIQAEAYINRASLLQTDSQNQELQIHYKVREVGLGWVRWVRLGWVGLVGLGLGI